MLSAVTRFQLWSPSHWAVLIFGITFLVVAIFAQRKNPQSLWARGTLFLLIFANLTAAIHSASAYLLLGLTSKLEGIIPLHLCDLVAFVAAAALITRKPIFCELTYYLGIGGTLQGLITPTLEYAFPHPVFFTFFHLHIFIVATALFLPLGLNWRPRRPLHKTLTRIFFLICGYLIFAYGMNSILGTNYAFVMHKPKTASLYDHLGPYPWCLLSMLALVIIALILLSLPFLFVKKETSPISDPLES